MSVLQSFGSYHTVYTVWKEIIEDWSGFSAKVNVTCVVKPTVCQHNNIVGPRKWDLPVARRH